MIMGLLAVAAASSIELFTAGFTLGITLMAPIVGKKIGSKEKNINKKRGVKLWDGLLLG